MSKAAKQGLIILIVLLVLTLGFAGYTVIEKQKVDRKIVQLDGKLRKATKQAENNAREAAHLKTSLDSSKQENIQLKRSVKTAKEQADSLLAQVSEKAAEANKFKSQVDELRSTRDSLMSKIQDLNSDLAAAKEAQTHMDEDVTEMVMEDGYDTEEDRALDPLDYRADEDSYWAAVLKAKVSLELELDDLNEELAENALEILDLKQENADMQIDIDVLMADKDEVENEIKFKEDMINNISLELARTRNDKKFVDERVTKLHIENTDLRRQLKSLVTTKGALEKSIVRISRDKTKMEKELGRTESIIQSKIDEIWEIKESLDRTLKSSRMPTPSREIELPPIIVSTDDQMQDFDPNISMPGFNGSIVSINPDNNFVITDIGQASGLRLGDHLSVYRESKYIARLEVIQVRNDISAADIKDQWTSVQVGDIVR